MLDATVGDVRQRDPLDPLLSAALEPVLADLDATVAVPLTIRDEPWSDHPGHVTAMIYTEDRCGSGISVLAKDSLADRVVSIADQLQDIVVEALWAAARPTNWPACPHHPAGHPLRAERTEHGPAWVCPTNLAVVAPIGSLDARSCEG
jgi:hypothetical protein